MSLSTIKDMYWETYADQSVEEGYTLVGVGDNVEEIVDLEAQVIELQRKYGKRAEIRVYKEE